MSELMIENGALQGFQLSPQQRRLWSLRQRGVGGLGAQSAVRLQGRLDPRGLHAALDRLVARYDVLRTSFRRLPGMRFPMQVIAPQGAVLFAVRETSGVSAEELDAEVACHFRQELGRTFESDGPMLRATLLRLAADEHLLLLSLNPLCGDAATLGNLMRELQSTYASLTGDIAAAEAFPYAQFADWQSALLAEPDDEEEMRGLWQRLATASAPGLPFESRRSASATAWEEPVAVPLSAPEIARLQAAVALCGVPTAIFLLASWKVLLWRLTGQGEIAVADLFDFRQDEVLEDAVGLFAKYLPVSTRLDGSLRFVDLLTRVAADRERVQELAASFIWDGPGLLQEGQAGPIPYGFELYRWPEPATAAGVTFSVHDQYVGIDACGIRLACTGSGDRLRLELHSDPASFRREDVAALAAQLRTLITAAAAAPEAALADLDILPQAERLRLLVAFNETGAVFPESSVPRLFEQAAERSPEADAVVCEGRRMSYRELDERANQVAHALRALGAGPDARVALYIDRSPEMLFGLLGILKAGAAYVPLDPDQPQRRLGYMLEDVGAPVILTRRHLAPALPETSARVICLDAGWEQIAAQPRQRPEVEILPESLAYVVFTSGSTGRPKGVAVEHRNLRNYVLAALQRLDLPAGASYAMVSTFAADLGNTSLFPSLVTGGCLHLLSPETTTDPEALAAYFRRHGVDCLKIVPSHLAALLEGADPEGVLPRQRLVLGGEATRWELLERIRALAPGCRVFNHYGPSETTVGVLTCPAGEIERDPRCATLPIGRPIPNARTYVLDGELRPVPAWCPGELYIGGEGVSRGYLGRPDLTAAVFIPDPCSGVPGARLYHTGDRVRYLSDGTIEFLGRVDHQVKVHGFRIELGEIRAALNEIPQIRDSVVAATRDEERGQQVLVAYYVSRREIEHAALRELLRTRLLEASIPHFFHRLKKMPLTLNGKINYGALPGLEEVKSSIQRTLIPPRNTVEEMLAGIWSDLLRAPAVSADDNFFELGGHSLLATQLVSRIRQIFAVELPLRVLFESPTVAGLARRVEDLLRTEPALRRPPLEPAPRAGELALSFAQERLWVMHQLEPDSPSYSIPICLQIAGPLQVPVLLASLREVVRRHETLRTVFPAAADERPIQQVSGEARQTLPVIDLTGLAAADQERETARQVSAEAARPFSLATGPLLRASLLRLDREEHRLLLTLHHIVSDAWSMDVLVREVTALYRAFGAGLASPLPPLRLQYADFAQWQRRTLQGETLEAHLAYWRRKLAGAPEVLSLPTDRPRPQARSSRGRTAVCELPAELASALGELSRREGVTLFMALLAAFNVLLRLETAQDDLVVGTDVANRNHLETEGLIGFFVNNLVLRTSLRGDPSFRELLRRVREVSLEAYAHQDLPFDELVKALRPKRSLSHAPLFQVLFVHQNAPATPPEVADLRIRRLLQDGGTSKFDLGVFYREIGGRLVGLWTFSTDLFEASTIERLAEKLQKILELVTSRPEVTLGELETAFAAERSRDAMEIQERQESKLKKLRSIRRQAVDLEEAALVRSGPLLADRHMPLRITPAEDDVDLVEWARENSSFLDRQLEEHGALLFRGFGSGSVQEFESFAQAIVTGDLFGEYGDLPAEEKGEKVYQSTPYPPDKVLLFHNESSHMDRWPAKQLFYCATAARAGGETPIVDCRRIYRRLRPEVREAFERKGLLYVRTFIPGIDVRWQDFFKTGDREAVARFCQSAGMEHTWDGDQLRTRQLSPAVIRHPRTGEPSFFNQIMLHHGSCLDPQLRASVLAVFGEEGLPRNVHYGDGSVIDDATVQEIVDLYWDEAVAFPWQVGDILMLDNMLIAHARNPFAGPRKIVVAMGEMINQSDL